MSQKMLATCAVGNARAVGIDLNFNSSKDQELRKSVEKFFFHVTKRRILYR